jgi:hypothetical protein
MEVFLRRGVPPSDLDSFPISSTVSVSTGLDESLGWLGCKGRRREPLLAPATAVEEEDEAEGMSDDRGWIIDWGRGRRSREVVAVEFEEEEVVLEAEAEERFWVIEMEVGMEEVAGALVVVWREVTEREEVCVRVRARRREAGRVGIEEAAVLFLWVRDEGSRGVVSEARSGNEGWTETGGW